MESPKKPITDLDQFVRRLKQALQAPLPGPEAQMKMAPSLRQMQPLLTDRPRQSAVLELLFPTSQGISLIFTVRPTSLKHHGGQISFPGGGVEAGDATYADAARRETQEELGIDTRSVEILGEMTSLFISPSQNIVHPYVGWMPNLPPLNPDPTEVASVLSVPLHMLLAPDTIGIHHWRRDGQDLTAPGYCVDHASIWGATAMMLSELLEVIRGMASETLLPQGRPASLLNRI